jgi:hypothetical protein
MLYLLKLLSTRCSIRRNTMAKKFNITHEITIICPSKCEKCKYGLKPSVCEPANVAVLKYLQENNFHWKLLQEMDRILSETKESI